MTASGYTSRRPRGPTKWGPPGAPPMQQPDDGYMQTGAYPTQTPQYNMHQPPYASYPLQAPSNFQPGWDQSSNQQTQQPTAAIGYEYYNQQQLQQQTQLQPMVGSSAPADNTSYNYTQPQGPQRAFYGTAPGYGPIANPSQDRSVPSQDGMNQVTPAQQQAHLVGPANQQGYASQKTPVTANGYGIPPTPQPNYGSQPPPQAGYGQPSQVAQLSYSQPLQLQAGYDQGSTDRAPPFQPTAPQAGYGPQQVYGGVGPIAQPSYGLQQQPYSDSYVSSEYLQPPAYSSDNATRAMLDQSAAAPAVPGGAAKASPS